MELSVIISFGALLSVILTSVILLSMLAKKAHGEGVRDQKIEDFEKDINGIGIRVDTLQSNHSKVNDKVIEIESVLVIKLENIENMLRDHIKEGR